MEHVALDRPVRDPRFQPAFVPETAWQMLDAGLDYSCYYHIRDYYVDREKFAEFTSQQGAAFMARWWNRMPQYDGLFDYQNTVRPAYFAFKLLSRLTGDRLMFESSDPAVHGFFTHDPLYQTHNLLVWNFSDRAGAGQGGRRRCAGTVADAAGVAGRDGTLLRRERAAAPAGSREGGEGRFSHRGGTGAVRDRLLVF